jgi:hypothetical protein
LRLKIILKETFAQKREKLLRPSQMWFWAGFSIAVAGIAVVVFDVPLQNDPPLILEMLRGKNDSGLRFLKKSLTKRNRSTALRPIPIWANALRSPELERLRQNFRSIRKLH